VNRKSFLGKLLVGIGAIVASPYLPNSAASITAIKNGNLEFIAGYIRMSNKMLSDIPRLMAFLQERLTKIILEENRI